MNQIGTRQLAIGIEVIGVIGSGTMGNGIAQVAARAGFRVILCDVKDEFLQRGMAAVEKSLQRDIDKERLTPEEKQRIVGRIKSTTNLEALDQTTFAIEAVTEDLAIKSQVFRELDRITPTDTVLASNTSSISITKLAAVTRRPDKVIGMHFMNPVPVMKLVEVIRGIATSDHTYEKVKTLSESLGKTPLDCQDSPGFVSNRVLMPMINEAIFCVMEGVGSPEAVDTVMKSGMNHPIGPLALADLIGLDICLNVLEVLQEGLGDPKYRPCPLLRKMVDAGQLGRKSGRGFYQY